MAKIRGRLERPTFKELILWKWPYQRTSMWGVREYSCPCGVGHCQGVHGCCGCCSNPSFVSMLKREDKKRDNSKRKN